MTLLAYPAFALVLFVVAARLMRRDPLEAVAFLLGAQLFLRILLWWTIPSLAFAAGTFVNLSIVLLFGWAVLKHPQMLLRRNTVGILGGIGLFLAYVVGVTTLRGGDTVGYLLFVRNFFFNFLLLLIVLNVPGRRPWAPSRYVRVAMGFVAVQVVLAMAQYASPAIADLFKVIEYERFGEAQLALQDVFADQKVVTGTLRSMQNVSSFIMINVVFFLSLRVASKGAVRRATLFALLGGGLAAMFLAGVRAPMIGLAIGLLLVSWQKQRVLTTIVVIVLAIAVPTTVATFSSEIDYATTAEAGADVERPMQRLIGALAVFDFERFSYTTLRHSVTLAEGFGSNLVFGSGLGLIFTEFSVTDAFLAVLVIEFGVVGVLLLLVPYLYVLWKLRTVAGRRIGAVGAVVFLVALSQSIVNEGLWADFANATFMFMIMILFRLATHEGSAETSSAPVAPPDRSPPPPEIDLVGAPA